MSRGSLPTILLALAFALPAARALAAPPDWSDEAVRRSRLAVHDWEGWNYRLFPDRLTREYLKLNEDLLPSPEYYDGIVRYQGERLAVDLDGFLALPPAEQDERRRLAETHYQEALALKRLLDDMWYQQQTSIKRPDMPDNVGRGVAGMLSGLTTATGLDPTHPAAWRDLAYFAGIAGDAARGRAALASALAALDLVPAEHAGELAARICLDAAWIEREKGRWREGLDWIAAAEERGELDQEGILVKGLLLAGAGDFNQATALARTVGSITVYKYVWGHLDSDFAQRWIQAMAYFQQGQLRQARHALGKLDVQRKFPFAHRFWSDVAIVHELLGLEEDAKLYHGMALYYRPYLIWLPFAALAGNADVHGQPGTGLDYFLGFHRFHLAGSLFSFGANYALLFQAEPDPWRRARLADAAIAALSTCRRRGIRPASALLIRGRVHYQLQEFEAAQGDLIQALDELRAAGALDAENCLVAGLVHLEMNRARAAMPYLRCAVEQDPEYARGWRMLGVGHVLEGDLEAARAAMDRSLELDGSSTLGWYNRGLLNFNQRRWKQAESDLAQAAVLDPDNREIAAFHERAARARSRAAQDPAGAAADAAAEVCTARATRTGDCFWVDSGGVEPTARDWARSRADAERIARAAGAPEPDGAAAPEEDPAALVARLRQAYAAAPDLENRLALSRALLAAGDALGARELLLPLWTTSTPEPRVCYLTLAADRVLGEAVRARMLARSLTGGAPPVDDAKLWSLVAFVCLDAGLNEEGLKALDAALVLDPGNVALQRHREFLAGHLGGQ